MHESLDEPQLSYESPVDDTTRFAVANRVERITAMRANMGVPEAVFPVRWLYIADVRYSGRITKDAESGNYRMDILASGVEGGQPRPGTGLVAEYDPNTGMANAQHRRVWSGTRMTRESWQQMLAGHILDAFDNSLQLTIREHWQHLIGRRSPEQAKTAAAQARAALIICGGILSEQPWTGTTRSRSRTITQGGVQITERQYASGVRSQPGVLERFFGVERPMLWNQNGVTVEVGDDVRFDIQKIGDNVRVYATGPQVEESEHHRHPWQVHPEADALEAVQGLPGNNSYMRVWS